VECSTGVVVEDNVALQGSIQHAQALVGGQEEVALCGVEVQGAELGVRQGRVGLCDGHF